MNTVLYITLHPAIVTVTDVVIIVTAGSESVAQNPKVRRIREKSAEPAVSESSGGKLSGPTCGPVVSGVWELGVVKSSRVRINFHENYAKCLRTKIG